MKKTLKLAVLLCLAVTIMLFAAACDMAPDEELQQTAPQQTTLQHTHDSALG